MTIAMKLLFSILSLLLLCSCASVKERDFFTLSDGRVAKLYTIENGTGFAADITDMGGDLIALRTPDKDGVLQDVVLGYAKPAQYEVNGPFYGALIGRFSNRITGGKITLDGKDFPLFVNEKERNNTLHGGIYFHRHLWKATPIDAATIKFSYMSPDGEGGFPGNLQVDVTYHVTKNNELVYWYHATTDAPTVVSLTNHTYYNLNGCTATDCKDHEVWSSAYAYTEVDDNLSVTGRVIDVDNTPYDLRNGRSFEDIYADKALPIAFDTNFCVAPKAGTMQRAVFKVVSHRTGITLEVDTDQPGVQFYSGYWMGPDLGKGNVTYKRYGAFAIETQNWPDAPNQPSFPNARLNPGQEYNHHAVYRFGVEK